MDAEARKLAEAIDAAKARKADEIAKFTEQLAAEDAERDRIATERALKELGE